MIKEEKIMREETKYRKFCDMCGEEILISLSCCKTKCSICSRDLWEIIEQCFVVIVGILVSNIEKK